MKTSNLELLLSNSEYEISNISKFLGEVTTDYDMARRQLDKVGLKIDAYARAIAAGTHPETKSEAILVKLSYLVSRIRIHTEKKPIQFEDKDALMFVTLIHYLFGELSGLASGQNEKGQS